MKLFMLFTIVCFSMVRSNTLIRKNSAKYEKELNANRKKHMCIDSFSDGAERSSGFSYSYNMGNMDIGKNGPKYWGDIYCKCGGTQQSPINIFSESNLVEGKSRNTASKIKIEFFGSSSSTLVNNGHTLQLTINNNKPKLFDYNIVPIKTYSLKQVHFHFACQSSVKTEKKTGSEHRIDGKGFDMEVHFVFKDNTGSFSVVGVLFNKAENSINKIAPNDPDLLKNFDGVRATKEIQNTDDLLKSFLPNNIYKSGTKSYYSYEGSLTTPPCSEGVQWNVIKDLQYVYPEFLEALQRLPSDTNHITGGLMCRNSRPIQNPQRTVYY